MTTLTTRDEKQLDVIQPVYRSDLTARERAEKKPRRREFITIFIHGKMKRIRRPLQIDGVDVDEFIRRNADPIWLHQNEIWEYIEEAKATSNAKTRQSGSEDDDEIPF